MSQERFERMFAEIIDSIPADEHSTLAIVKALQIVALELSELNVAASKLMDVPDQLNDVIAQLELLDPGDPGA